MAVRLKERHLDYRAAVSTLHDSDVRHSCDVAALGLLRAKHLVGLLQNRVPPDAVSDSSLQYVRPATSRIVIPSRLASFNTVSGTGKV